MKTIPFSQVIQSVAYLLGIDPELDLLKDHARAFTDVINNRLADAWDAWPWPQLEICEERAFRQVWQTDIEYHAAKGEGSEVYYIPTAKYYLARSGTVPIGTLPTDPLHWVEFEPDRYLPYEVIGKRDINEVVAVNRTNPRANKNVPTWPFAPSGNGIDLPFSAGPTIWPTFRPPAPTFSSMTWSPSLAYQRGDVRMQLNTGECFVALRDHSNHPFTDVAFWLIQDFPAFLSAHVTTAAAADLADDGAQKADFRAEAEKLLAKEISKQIRQGQRTKYRRFGTGPRQSSWDRIPMISPTAS